MKTEHELEMLQNDADYIQGQLDRHESFSSDELMDNDVRELEAELKAIQQRIEYLESEES
jgi:prefoldin subunit 5